MIWNLYPALFSMAMLSQQPIFIFSDACFLHTHSHAIVGQSWTLCLGVAEEGASPSIVTLLLHGVRVASPSFSSVCVWWWCGGVWGLDFED